MDKQFFSVEDFCAITGCSKSSVYKITSARLINYHKPFGKKIFFTWEQIQEAMTKGFIKSKAQIESELRQNGGRIRK